MGINFTRLLCCFLLALSFGAGALERGDASKVYFTAIDSTDGSFKTGDSANITADISKDGGADAPLTDTSATEVDATNMPGLYWFDVSGTETTADVIAIQAQSTTSNIVLDPVTIYTNDWSALATAAAVAALNDLSAAQVNAEVDSALSDYDGPTNAEMAARTLVSASYFDAGADDVATDSASRTASQADLTATDAAIAALNDLSAAQVNAEVDSALADYDGPTNAEMEARTILAAGYYDPSTDEVITDAASRTASKADVSLLALEATLQALNDITVAEIWSEPQAGYSTAGDFGYNLDAQVSAAGGGSAPTVEQIDAELTANHGGGSWTGTAVGGTYVYTWTETGYSVADVLCEIYTDAERTTFETSKRTDAFGVVEFDLEPGTYYLVRKKSGRVFSNPTPITVEAT
jgi:hypothetical protein